MSRIGRLPIEIPQGVQVNLVDNHITVKGPKGELQRDLPAEIKVEVQDNQIVVTRPSEEREHKALHGLTRTLVANMVEGVTKGFEKKLEIVGVGYRAALQGNKLVLQMGYSHPVEITPPAGIEIEVPAPTRITVKGIDKEKVGALAADIRAVRPPEPYKGKGIRYEGEYVRRKVGKAGA
ncbi:MAG: 50S ribosomal protein L6 [bacterium]|jgi:large subunit ribosomal protein L6|nr:50S ribosomal protein L6 [Bacillota bacterium]HHW54470.1 50S ribosomal protein L6 [Bacillota bacterium]